MRITMPLKAHSSSTNNQLIIHVAKVGDKLALSNRAARLEGVIEKTVVTRGDYLYLTIANGHSTNSILTKLNDAQTERQSATSKDFLLFINKSPDNPIWEKTTDTRWNSIAAVN